MSDQSVALQGFWDRNVNYFSLLPSAVKPQVSHGDVPCFCYAGRHRAGDAVPFESPHTSGRHAPVSAARRTLSSSLWVPHPSTAGLSAGCLCGKCTAHSPLPAAASVRTGLRVPPCRTCQMSTDSSTSSLVVIPRRSCHRDLLQRAFVNVKYCSLFLYRNGRTTEGCRLACS